MKNHNLIILYFLGLMLAVSAAFPSYIRTTFLKEFVGLADVGLFFIASSCLAIVAISYFPLFIKRLGNYKLSLIVFMTQFVSIMVLITTKSVLVAFIAFTLVEVTGYLLWINMDLFVERYTANRSTGRTRTIYFTFLNIGWFMSPLLTGILVNNGDFRKAYWISAMMIFLVFWLIILNKKRFQDSIKYIHNPSWQTLKNVVKNNNLRYIFLISLWLKLFYCVAVLYVPIYLNEFLGFSWPQIGVIFTVMLVPFLILEIPAGVLADKYSAEKNIFVVGFLIMIAALFLIYLSNSTDLMVWAIILFLSRCGAALVEAMQETYFFKIVDVQDIDYINLFRNVSPLGYLLGSCLSVIIISLYSIKALFLVLAIIMIVGIFYAYQLDNVKKIMKK